jgi:uncharacterized repeat protein (TIGR03803 family)
MKSYGFYLHAIGITTALASLAGCTGSPSSAGAPGALPQAPATEQNSQFTAMSRKAETRPAVRAWQALYKFKNASLPNMPFWGVVRGKDGKFYGTTENGAPGGMVFELSPAENKRAKRYALIALHYFEGVPDGFIPHGPLLRDSEGRLFGVTEDGGGCGPFNDGCGIVYSLTPSAGGYTESVLWRFKDVPDGAFPIGNLIVDAGGALYGVTEYGGSHDWGTVFKLTPNSGSYTEAILHSFGGPHDGQVPYAGLSIDSTGSFFSTTLHGGAKGAGIVYKLSPDGTQYSESVLYDFKNGRDYRYPVSGITIGASGTLFGLAATACCEAAYALTPHRSTYKESTIFTFRGVAEGEGASSPLLPARDGEFFGEMSRGGLGSGTGYGLIYELAPDGTGYKDTVLHRFNGRDGNGPEGGLILDAGNLYGTTVEGGHPGCVYGCGTVFAYRP